jgi:hypothetical protein
MWLLFFARAHKPGVSQVTDLRIILHLILSWMTEKPTAMPWKIE